MKLLLTHVLLPVVIVFCAFPGVEAQPTVNQPFSGIGFERYYERTEFLMASPGAMKFGLYGYDNPALLQYVHQPDISFHWTSDTVFGDSPRWGAFFGFPNSSFGLMRNEIAGQTYRDYRIAIGGGSDVVATGLAINWFGGDTDMIDLKTNMTVGTLLRPGRSVSIGLTGTSAFKSDYYEAVADVAIRPLGTPLLTVFGDYAVDEQAGTVFDGRWSAGAAIEALPGVRFTGRYIDDVGFTAGVQVSFGRSGVSYQSHMDSDGNHRYNSYSVRAGAIDRNVFDRYFRKDRSYVDIDVRGGMPYQTFRYFDERATYLRTLEHIHEAAADPSVLGIVINTTHMKIDQAKTWEIRKALEDFRQSEKKVVIYVERGGMSAFHLASVADYVVMDPMGSLMIPGYVTGTTYISELLESVGIGVDEFREMEYKSAFEALSRTEMSDADREQRQLIIDDFYELVRADVTAGRGLTDAQFDTLIDKGISLTPKDLVAAGIVDTLARFTDINNIIENLHGGKKERIKPEDLYVYHKPRDDKWGTEHKISVLYAEGPTMATTGIHARKLSAAIRVARNDPSVKAVVMRADSPGGDALASDLVAEEIRKTAEVKPVIVSMGSVAASGGYWISMYADSIVAAPNTVTGSIGVIGGWLWNQGLSDHLRLNTDYVSRGASADLTFGPTLPLIGLRLPDRPLTAEERENLISYMNGLYEDFIEKVATGRDRENDEIREVAGGRIWTGTRAVDNGLVDELGSLYTAIRIAKEKAGLKPSDKIKIVEGPEMQPFSLPVMLGRVFSSEPKDFTRKDPMKEYLELMIDQSGNPLVIMPFEYFNWMYYLEQQHP